MTNTVIAAEIARAQNEALQPKTSKTIMSSFDLVWGKSNLVHRLLNCFYLSESFDSADDSGVDGHDDSDDDGSRDYCSVAADSVFVSAPRRTIRPPPRAALTKSAAPAGRH